MPLLPVPERRNDWMRVLCICVCVCVCAYILYNPPSPKAGRQAVPIFIMIFFFESILLGTHEGVYSYFRSSLLLYICYVPVET